MIEDFEETAIYHQLASEMVAYNNSEKLVIAIQKCMDFIKYFLCDEDLKRAVAIPSRIDHGCRLRLFIIGRRIDLLFGYKYIFYYSDINDHLLMFAFQDAPPYSSFHDIIMKDLELFRCKCSK